MSSRTPDNPKDDKPEPKGALLFRRDKDKPAGAHLEDKKVRDAFHQEVDAREAEMLRSSREKEAAYLQGMQSLPVDIEMVGAPGGPGREMKISFGNEAIRNDFMKTFFEFARAVADKEGLEMDDIENMIKTRSGVDARAGDERSIYIQPVELMGEPGVFISKNGEPSISFNSQTIRDVFLEMTGLRQNRCKTKELPNWDRQVDGDYVANTYAPKQEEAGASVVRFNPHLLGLPGQKLGDQVVNIEAGRDAVKELAGKPHRPGAS